MLATKTGLVVQHQRLYYMGKELRDDVALSEYMIRNESTLFLVQRLEGGSSKPFKASTRPLPSHLKKSSDPCSICYESPSLVMPCKHTYCSNCIAEHAWSEASQTAKLRSQVNCCLCGSEWSFQVLMEYGAMTKDEIALLSECLSTNFLRDPEKFIQCPGCDVYCERINDKRDRVRCHFCYKKGKPDFCWHCKKGWKDGSNSNSCGNCDDNSIIEQLRSAPYKQVIGVSCPSIRLCPQCGTLTEHIERCKHMKCKLCQLDFCFICLREKVDGSWACGAHNYKCAVAAVQTVVPKKS